MKKYIFSFILITFVFYQVSSQTLDPNISFDSPVHDFEKLKEEEGKVTHNFEFTNTGGKPLI
ncbi:MAG: hypothetical protein AMS27_15570, partial [Bacteroides sp. SM23_62_1]